MTREERAEKWFRGIQDSESISIEKQMDICDMWSISVFNDFCLFSQIITAKSVLFSDVLH